MRQRTEIFIAADISWLQNGAKSGNSKIAHHFL